MYVNEFLQLKDQLSINLGTPSLTWLEAEGPFLYFALHASGRPPALQACLSRERACLKDPTMVDHGISEDVYRRP